jgi:hypothetical protein
MSAPNLHADAVPLNYLIGQNLVSAFSGYGYADLTNTTINAATTNQTLQDAVTAAVGHADESYAKKRINLAITFGSYDTSLSDARVLAATTEATLLANTNGSLTSSFQQQMPE